jgi:hypothetical protein
MVGGPSYLDRLPMMSSCAELDNVPVPDRRMIPMPRVRFTLGQMMIAVAILALLMGGAIWLAAVTINTIQAWVSCRRAERLAGAVLLQVVRPWLKQLATVDFLLYAVVFIASGASAATDMRATAASLPASHLVNGAADILLLLACIGLLLYWPFFRWTRLEFRERGVIYQSGLWPWESIREWGWKDGGYTLRLKVPYDIMWYRIAQGDKESVQAILEQHLGLVKNLS